MSDSARLTRITALRAAARERIVLLDGAKGAFMQGMGLTEQDFRGNRLGNSERDLKGNFDILALTKPSALTHVHDAFLAAGSDIIQTNTFNANRVSQADYATQHLVAEINFEAAAKHPFEEAKPIQWYHHDGSVADW